MKNSIYPQMKKIETEKFILRPARLSDAKDMFEYYKEDRVVKYLPFNAHKSLEETKRFIDTFFLKNYREGKIGHLAIVSKEDRKVIGNIGLNNVKVGDSKAEIGICINPKYWGNDIATKLTVCTLKYGFDYLNMDKLIAITYEDNKYTQKSLESLGFKYVSQYKKKIGISYVECRVFELHKRDYILYKSRMIYKNILPAKIIW